MNYRRFSGNRPGELFATRGIALVARQSR